MPTYEYLCDDCGDFTAFRPVAVRNDPHPCPTCGVGAPRVVLSAPTLATMPSTARAAHATNERAAHVPLTSAEYRARRHGPGCSCCSGSKPGGTVKTPDGAKTFPGKRPWMISH